MLSVPRDASVEQLNASLSRIQNKYRNDPSDAGRRLVELAEEAYKRIQKKRSISRRADRPIPLVDTFNFARIFDGMTREQQDVGPTRHATSYSYVDIDGNVREQGTVNGRPMSEVELQRYRPAPVHSRLQIGGPGRRLT